MTIPPPCPHTFFQLEVWGMIGAEAVLSVGWGNINVCTKRLLFQILSVLMQIHRVNKHQKNMIKNYTSLLPPADGLVSRWGSSTSSHWRSSQLFWLSLHNHTYRYGIERCRICFFIMYQVMVFCSMQRDWSDVFWQRAGCA